MSAELERRLEAARSPRTVNQFTMPDSIPGEIRNIGILELNAQEELSASKRAAGDPFRIAYELAKQALVEVNGEKVSLMDGTADKAWATMHPMARELVVKAHQATHNASEDQTAVFLKSRTIDRKST